MADSQRAAFVNKAAKKFKKGNFTASETGAKEMARKNFETAQYREILNSAGEGTKAFEERSIQKSPRPTRKKGY